MKLLKKCQICGKKLSEREAKVMAQLGVTACIDCRRKREAQPKGGDRK